MIIKSLNNKVNSNKSTNEGKRNVRIYNLTGFKYENIEEFSVYIEHKILFWISLLLPKTRGANDGPIAHLKFQHSS